MLRLLHGDLRRRFLKVNFFGWVVNTMTENSARGVPLSANRLLTVLPDDALARLEEISRRRTFAVRDKVIEQGDNSRDVFFVLSGQAHVLMFAETGRIVSFASIGPGGYFGELAAIDGQLRSATVVAAEPLELATLTASQFSGLLNEHPPLTATLLSHMAEVIRRCDDRIFNLSSLKASQRVYLELLHLAGPDPGGTGDWVVYPIPTQKALAGTVGTTRETVARVLRSLLGESIIERRSRSFHIRDRERLESLALLAKEED